MSIIQATLKTILQEKKTPEAKRQNYFINEIVMFEYLETVMTSQHTDMKDTVGP